MISTTMKYLFAAMPGFMVAPTFAAAPYQFSIDTAQSSFVGNASFSAETSGTLVGDYDATTNPTGTRTKPGLFGSFGATENLPVMVSVSPMLGGPLTSSTAGTFEMVFDQMVGSVTLSNYQVDLLADGPVSLPAELELEYETFRTRDPESLFVGGFPISLPLGDGELVSLTASQAIAGSMGALSSTGPGTFDFEVATLLTIEGEFRSPLGSTAIPGLPFPFVLQGQVSLSGSAATVNSMSLVDLSSMANPNVKLPQFSFGLPTVLPPGGTATLLFNLTLAQLGGTVNGTQSLVAHGSLVPEPIITVWLLPSCILLRLRRIST